MALNNDQAIPEMAEDFGAAEQVNSGIIAPNLQAIAEIELYRRRVFSSTDTVVTVALTTTAILTYTCPVTESRRWIFTRLENKTGKKLLVIGTIQRGSSSQLFNQVVQVKVSAGLSIVLVGPYERFSMSQSPADALMFPRQFDQPTESDFVLKITEAGGGVIDVGEIEVETRWERMPPWRRWGTGRPDKIEVLP